MQKTAIISVFNKTNVTNLANHLIKNDYTIISSGGTYKLLKNEINSNKIISVEEYTQSPEMLNGRVKTLHPKIHGGILATRSENDINDLNRLNIFPIDLVVCNLYPFDDVVSSQHETIDAIENIDIGGVTLIRAAFKNYYHVCILTDHNDYTHYMDNIDNINIDTRKEYAIKAMEHISDYDTSISGYFNKDLVYRKFKNIQSLKYGCNPHQNNSNLYKINDYSPFEVLNGTPGYINYMDAIQSWCLVSEISSVLNIPSAASFKHTTPAGVGTSLPIPDIYNDIYNIDPNKTSPVSNAFIRARTADPLSSFGDFIAIHGVVDIYTAKLIKREVSDGIIALDYSPEAYELLKTKKNGKYIILKGNNDVLEHLSDINEYRELNGIGLSQNVNNSITNYDFFNNVPTTKNTISDDEKNDLIIANITLKYTPSNSIAFACIGQIIGVGAGQQNRVDCVKLAGNKAIRWALITHPKTLNIFNKFKPELKRQDRVNAVMQFLQFNKNHDSVIDNILIDKWKLQYISSEYNVTHSDFITSQEIDDFVKDFPISMASDAFFPFNDNIDCAYKFGVKNILQPGGSIADESVINSCNDYNMYMAMSGVRVFTH